jgi:DNA-directed RNA polymerase subunit RPC12/RpoP
MDEADKTMVKRYKFQCWNCPKVYFQSLEITDQQEIIVACPYCRSEAVVNLRPYRKKTRTVFRREEDSDRESEEEFQSPEIFPTRKPG